MSADEIRQAHVRIDMALLRIKSWVLAVLVGTFMPVALVSSIGQRRAEFISSLLFVLLMPLSPRQTSGVRGLATVAAMVLLGLVVVLMLRYMAVPRLIVWLCSQ